VEPSTAWTEADVTAHFGTIRKVLGRSASGLRLVSYPMGGAQAEFDDSGRVVRFTVMGGIADNGLSL
jgi:hypothetical protein